MFTPGAPPSTMSGGRANAPLEQRIAGLEQLVTRLIGVLVMHDLASEEDFPELK